MIRHMLTRGGLLSRSELEGYAKGGDGDMEHV